MNAVCLVAHPDDCVIFGYSYMYHHPEMNWTVAYLTYQAHQPRALEFVQFWGRRNIPVRFIGLEDHWHDQEQGCFTRWPDQDAMQQCWQLAKDYDLVLTHDEHGDYGHIHHKLVHNAVKHHPQLVTFAPPGQGKTYTLPKDAYSLDELLLHGDIVKSFHQNQHSNSYKELL